MPNNKFHEYSLYSLYASCFFLPLLAGPVSIFMVLAILLGIKSGALKQFPLVVKNNGLAIIALALYSLFIIGSFYTPAPIDDALNYIKKYRILFYIPIILTLCYGQKDAAERGSLAFAGGSIVALLISYLMWFGLVPLEDGSPSLARSLDHNGIMAFLCFFCLQNIIAKKPYRGLWLALFAITTFNIFYVVASRTGQVIYICFLLLTIAQNLSWKKQIVATLIVCLGVVFVYNNSPRFAHKVNRAITEIQSFKRGSNAAHTSVGLRLEWTLDSIELTQQKPILGHGTAAFGHARKGLHEHMLPSHGNNPHSEYFNMLVQFGFVGFFLFIGLMVIALKQSFQLPTFEKKIAQGLVIFIAVGCIPNSWLLTSLPSHFFAMMIALYLAPITEKTNISLSSLS